MPQPKILHVDLVALDQVLERLFAIDAHQAQIVEQKYFGGLSVEETAKAGLRQQIGEA